MWKSNKYVHFTFRLAFAGWRTKRMMSKNCTSSMSIYSDSTYMKRNATAQCKLVYLTAVCSYIASHPIRISIGLTAQILYLFRYVLRYLFCILAGVLNLEGDDGSCSQSLLEVCIQECLHKALTLLRKWVNSHCELLHAFLLTFCYFVI